VSSTRDALLWLLKLEKGFALEVPFRGLSGKRRFRFDAAHEDTRVAVDYHGWGYGTGAHMYREKQAGDHEKLNEAVLCGWVYLVCDARSVESGRCVEYVDAALRNAPRVTERHRWEWMTAGEAIACDAWVVRLPDKDTAYQLRGGDDGNRVIGKARQAFQAGDTILPDEVYWPERDAG
jgi:hypothetical protein